MNTKPLAGVLQLLQFLQFSQAFPLTCYLCSSCSFLAKSARGLARFGQIRSLAPSLRKVDQLQELQGGLQNLWAVLQRFAALVAIIALEV